MYSGYVSRFYGVSVTTIYKRKLDEFSLFINMQTSNNFSFAKIYIHSADNYKIVQHVYHIWLTVKEQLNKLFFEKKKLRLFFAWTL